MTGSLDFSDKLCNLLDSIPEWMSAIGTIGAVIVALFQDKWRKKEDFKKAKKALEEELLYNLTQLFTTEIERPLLYGSYDFFVTNYMDSIKNSKNLSKIQFIYSQFRYYDRFIQSFYLRNVGVVDTRYCTEKQVQAYNRIFEILELGKICSISNKIHQDNGHLYIEELRNNQIENYNSEKKAITDKIFKTIDNI